MQRYFFNVTVLEPINDLDGVMLEDDAACWKEATIHAAEILKEIDGSFRPGQSWSVEVVND
jgi:hypothetical protein